jgi:hypothetical protein
VAHTTACKSRHESTIVKKNTRKKQKETRLQLWKVFPWVYILLTAELWAWVLNDSHQYLRSVSWRYVGNSLKGWRFILRCNNATPSAGAEPLDGQLEVMVQSWGYSLLLRGGIIQSIPYTAVILWSIVSPNLSFNYSWFIHQSSLAKIPAETPRSAAGRNLAKKVR